MWTVRTRLYNFSLLLVLIFTQAQWTVAEPETTNPAYFSPTPSPTPTSTYNVFSAIASAHPSANYGVQPGNVASNPTNQAGNNAAGASGGSDGSMNLSTGATIAIIVVVCVVILGGGKPAYPQSTWTSPLTLVTASTAVLYYFAKKRQWEIREKLRSSARRVTGLGRPKTPKTPMTPKTPKPRVTRIDPPSPSQARRYQSSEEEKTPILTDEQRQRSDIEQGLWTSKKPSVVQVVPESGVQSSFDMDSPRTTSGPTWGRVFAKR